MTINKATPGTVAVLIREDGTREVVRKCVADDGAATIPLNGSARLETVDNSQWYAEGVAWAEARASSGVTAADGLGQRQHHKEAAGRYPVAIRRGPVATDRELRFADADKTGGWAVDALCRAAENGILNGKDGGILDSAGLATRAETAQMLKISWSGSKQRQQDGAEKAPPSCCQLVLQNGVDIKNASGMPGHYSTGFSPDTYQISAGSQ